MAVDLNSANESIDKKERRHQMWKQQRHFRFDKRQFINGEQNIFPVRVVVLVIENI